MSPRSRCLTLSCLLQVSFSTHADIRIDGVLDEPEWQQARVFDAFVTTEPLTGEAAKYRTVALLYTNTEGIFVGFRNYQPPGVTRVQRQFARDAIIAADRNYVGIDFDASGFAGYEFTVGASNTRTDGIYSKEKELSLDWDGTWYSQTSQDENYWYSEIHIPWTVAPMTDPAAAQKTMTFLFGRFVFDETLRFVYPNVSTQRKTFLTDWAPVDIEQEKTATLDWFPYVAAGHERQEDNSELRTGLDVVWRPSSASQFTGTINPDFGQVESDDLVVNFSAFETFFSEKRPFFTENQALFNSRVPLGDRLIHTRRVGAASDAGDEEVTDINLGAKLSHYGQNLDLGFFAVTEDDTSLSEGRNYLATRIQGRTLDTALGHTLTYADRPTLEREAMVNSVDWDWQAGVQSLRGQGFHSDIQQDGNEFNDWEDLDDQDVGGWLEYTYQPNDRWRYRNFAYYYGDTFDMNDLGFLKRNDWMRLTAELRHDVLEYPGESRLRSSWYYGKLAYEENNAGEQLLAGVDLQRYWISRSTRELDLKAHLSASSWDDRITRGNGSVKLDPQQSFKAIYLNPRGGRTTFQLQYTAETKGTDKFAHEFRFTPQFYLAEKVTLSADLAYTWFDEWLLWDFDTEQLATYRSDLYEVDLKVDWYPSTRQEVRVKFQWVGVDSQAQQSFRIGQDGRLDPSAIPVSDFDFSDTALQVRYRYELAPLSDIFLVYTRGGFDESDESGRDPMELFSDAWDNVTTERIIAKIRYRF